MIAIRKSLNLWSENSSSRRKTLQIKFKRLSLRFCPRWLKSRSKRKGSSADISTFLMVILCTCGLCLGEFMASWKLTQNKELKHKNHVGHCQYLRPIEKRLTEKKSKLSKSTLNLLQVKYSKSCKNRVWFRLLKSSDLMSQRPNTLSKRRRSTMKTIKELKVKLKMFLGLRLKMSLKSKIANITIITTVASLTTFIRTIMWTDQFILCATNWTN